MKIRSWCDSWGRRDVAVFNAQGNIIPPNRPYCGGWEWDAIQNWSVILYYWPDENPIIDRLFARIQTPWGQVDLQRGSAWELARTLLGVWVGDPVQDRIEAAVEAAFQSREAAAVQCNEKDNNDS